MAHGSYDAGIYIYGIAQASQPPPTLKSSETTSSPQMRYIRRSYGARSFSRDFELAESSLYILRHSEGVCLASSALQALARRTTWSTTPTIPSTEGYTSDISGAFAHGGSFKRAPLRRRAIGCNRYMLARPSLSLSRGALVLPPKRSRLASCIYTGFIYLYWERATLVFARRCAGDFFFQGRAKKIEIYMHSL